MSYNLNRLQSLDTETPFLVTLNPDRTPHSVHAQMTYRHPIFTNESVASQDAIRDLNGRDRTYFCGAYLGYGFHEDGLRAGVEVARHFDARVVA
jgi:predicted NAD/FAD-binding protein